MHGYDDILRILRESWSNILKIISGFPVRCLNE